MQVVKTVVHNFEGSLPPRLLVVIVDDNALVLEALSLCLEGWEVDCIAVATEQEAISALKLESRIPDLILSDYNLGQGKLGDTVISSIRDKYGAEIPAMLFTGDMVHGAAEARNRTDLNGIPLLTKPITGRVLKDTIDWLKSKS